MISQQKSQDEQGFIPTKLVAKFQQVDDIRDSKGKQCKALSSFYLPSWQGQMKYTFIDQRQQLPESLQKIQQFQIEQWNGEQGDGQTIYGRLNGTTRNNSSFYGMEHPFRAYAQNSTYQLVPKYTLKTPQMTQSTTNSSTQVSKRLIQENYVILQTAETKIQKQLGQARKGPINTLRNPYSRLVKSFDYSNTNPIPRNNSSQSNSSKNIIQLLTFDSKFESGNLYCVYHKINTNQYHLFVQNDTNSYGYNQWFYFSLANIRKDTQYKLVIVNFKKKLSFFKTGFKPILFSLKKYQQNGNKDGWYRSGINIQYNESNITTSKFFKFYKLTFTIKFKHDDDYVLIAPNLPYSFTKLSSYLQKFMRQFKESNQNQEIADLKILTVGRTFCGNNVPQIKITPKAEIIRSKSPSKIKRKTAMNQKMQKKMIIFLARQHPGETVSSYLMENVLQQLSKFGIQTQKQGQKQKQQKIKLILKTFTIVIFPMINIDGVIYGNSRCDVSGMDLNRRWKNPSKIFHPQIYNIKSKIQSYAKKYDVMGCFDLHGHSKLYNVFCYSCKVNPVTCRILPYLISKQTQRFYFPSCTFGITRYKSTTARAAIFKIIKNENVLTIEASYFGYIQANLMNPEVNKSQIVQKRVIKYFQPKTFQQIAMGILCGLSDFFNKQASKVYLQVEKQIKQKFNQILDYERHNQAEQQGSGSQSDPEGDEIDFQTKINTILGKDFLDQAQFFRPAQPQIQMINISSQIYTRQLQLEQNINPTNNTPLDKQVNQDLQSQTQRIGQNTNKIRIQKRRTDRKNLSNQKFRSQEDYNSIETNKIQNLNNKKQTTSFSVQRNQKVASPKQRNRKKSFSQSNNQLKTNNVSERLYSQNNQRLIFGSKKYNNMPIKDNPTILIKEDHQKDTFKVYDDLVIYNSDSKQAINYEKRNLMQRQPVRQYVQSAQNQFFIKFQKFLPSHHLPIFGKKQKLSSLQQSIYKDDQRQILNTLLQNKKRLQRQKILRQAQKSTKTGERLQCKSNIKEGYRRKQQQARGKSIITGVSGGNDIKKEQIVDFRRFKDRDRLRIQIKYANQSFSKYTKNQGLY